jgi:hypothetical protein
MLHIASLEIEKEKSCLQRIKGIDHDHEVDALQESRREPEEDYEDILALLTDD